MKPSWFAIAKVEQLLTFDIILKKEYLPNTFYDAFKQQGLFYFEEMQEIHMIKVLIFVKM